LFANALRHLNALRGHLTEFGLIVAKGAQNLPKLIALVNDPTSGLPEAVREILVLLIEQLQSLDARVEKLDRGIARRAKEDKLACRLMTIPGIGPVTATR
jgi:transposase